MQAMCRRWDGARPRCTSSGQGFAKMFFCAVVTVNVVVCRVMHRLQGCCCARTAKTLLSFFSGKAPKFPGGGRLVNASIKGMQEVRKRTCRSCVEEVQKRGDQLELDDAIAARHTCAGAQWMEVEYQRHIE